MPKEDQGVSKDRYMLIPRVLVFIFNGDRVLLIKGAAHKRIWANRYNGVGGHVERSEDILSAARRETFEETGLDMPELELCGMVNIDTGEDIGIGVFVFRGKYAGGELVESREGKVEWISLEETNGLPLVEDLPFLLQNVSQHSKNRCPFSAHYSYDHSGHLVIRLGE
jgi:8-oxo-dGTP diphosphatase